MPNNVCKEPVPIKPIANPDVRGPPAAVSTPRSTVELVEDARAVDHQPDGTARLEVPAVTVVPQDAILKEEVTCPSLDPFAVSGGPGFRPW